MKIQQHVIDDANSDIVRVIGSYIQLKKNGGEYEACCPFHSEKTPSFKVNPNKKLFHCFGCGASGDAVEFVMKHTGCQFHEAIEKITGNLPQNPIETRAKRDSEPPKWAALRHAPEDAPEPNFKHYKHGMPSAKWAYHDARGNLVGYVCRFEITNEDGSTGKEAIPITWAKSADDGKEAWRWLSFATPRPMLGLLDLIAKPSAKVLVVEGEKTREAAAKLFPHFAVVTWAGGGNAVGKTDFKPLKSRQVCLWPDFDHKKYKEPHPQAGQTIPAFYQSGVKAMFDIYEKIKDYAADCKIIAPADDSPCGWDLADDGWYDGFNAKEYAKNNIHAAADWFASEKEKAKPPIAAADSAAPIKTAVSDSTPIANKDYFRVLGYDHDKYYFYPRLKKQIVEKSEFTEKTFLELAPLIFWESYFPNKNGFDKRAATDWLITSAHAKGIFDRNYIRGRGAWLDNDRIVYHFGHELLVDGKTVDTSEIDSRYFYELNRRLELKETKPLTADEGKKLLEISQKFRWVKPASAVLLLGWTALAPICGALKWRPHLWLTGGAGCGKTTVLNAFVHHLMGGFDIFAQGNSTEAGIRQRLHSDALPVLFDESEQNNEKEQNRVQNILSLIRQASSESGAITLKGTAAGSAMNFTIRSMFCLSSIQVGLKHQADVERLTILALQPKHEDYQAADTWSKLKEELYKLEKDTYIGHRLLMRALSNIKNTLQNVSIFVSVASEKFGSVREGDQCGTLAAGCWSTINDGVVTAKEAKQWLDSFDWAEYRTVDADESIKAFNALLESTVRVKDLGDVSIFDIVKAANSYNPKLTRDEADNILQRYGMRVDKGFLFISNNSSSLESLIKHTPYAADIRGQLLRVKGSKKEDKPKRFNGIVSKCISINLGMFDFS